MEELRQDKLSQLSGRELLDLLVFIQNYDLEYRDSLNLDYNVTFGVEIEYERMIRRFVDKYLSKNFVGWTSKDDMSLKFGGEVSSPILNDTIECWEDLKEICEYFKKRKVITTSHAGGHIHVGAHILGDDYNNWRRFVKTYAVYEDILFRFLYGDKFSPRMSINKYAHPVADNIFWKIDEINEVTSLLDFEKVLPSKYRSQSLNLRNVKFHKLDNLIKVGSTVEFRSPNSTVEEVIWQNNINALTKLMVATTSTDFDEDFVDYQIISDNIPDSRYPYTYYEVLLKKVLDFVDLIFDNTLDKVYFLRQYIKNFEEMESAKTAFKAKRFIKKP